MEGHIPISLLRPELEGKFCVLGVIISAERPRATQTKYATTPASKRYVFNFTIRDEYGDSINASCWGTVDYVSPLSSVCYIGAQVKIFNARVQESDMKAWEYLPEVTSQCKLHLDNQISSSLSLYDGCDYALNNSLQMAFHTPPKTNSCKRVSVLDLMKDNSIYSEGDFVTMVAVVVEVGPILDFKTKDRKGCRQEIKLMDQSARDMYVNLVLWEPLLQMFTLEWKPCNTVLQLTNVKLSVEKNTNRRNLSATPRSILTIDPITDEGRRLAGFSTRLDPCVLSRIFQQQYQTEQFIRNKAISVSNVAALFDFSRRLGIGSREQVVLYCMVMNIRLERGLSAKCGHCGKRTGYFDEYLGSPLCTNVSCRDKELNDELYFDLNVSLADSTGLMTKFRLTGDFAQKSLQVTPEEFLTMKDDERQNLENRFWLEYFEIGVLIENRSHDKIVFRIIHMEPIDFSL